MVDGLIGQGLPVVVLVTTNEPLRDGDGSARTLASLFGHGHGLEREEKRPFGFSVN